MKVLIKTIAFLVLIFSLFMLYDKYELKQKTKFQALERIDPLPKTIEYIEEEKYADAFEYLGFFMDYVRNNPKAWEINSGLQEKRDSYEYRGERH